ncbi:hypothetical protein A2160_06250 [Candidatus Beckwithbacteria bacterium RBG_13_42_9]|uniref:Prepilin-type N-terminal cleavage/methylation domain-containing protein n=1 Tax=Candidatus Beckwithbacteria bacterium RBG_13_42_9 TaxID=1797457 RepID=A0A1F5E5L2_9BACT|nr:MAG: hypothetical protein A2160_06250 [Candidatus Beckwithbacteria bacterium RBG_13_42_9]
MNRSDANLQIHTSYANKFIRGIRIQLASFASALRHSHAGFTLVELLLYASIVGAVVLSMAGFLSLLMQSRVKNQTISEVEQQGVQVMQIITQTSRNAASLNSPTQGQTASSLSLDATVFDLSSGTIRITEGGSPISLTNSRVTASALTFKNLSRTDTPGTIRIQFTLTHVNPQGRNEYNFSKTFYGSASLR